MAGFTDVREITAWRLAHQLKLRVELFLGSPDFRHHYRACASLAEAARSGPGNIAAGHAQVEHKDFVRLVLAAQGAEAEVLRHLVEAHEHGLITSDELQINAQLTRRAMRSAAELIRGVKRCRATSASETA